MTSRHGDLAEPVAYVPAAEGAGDGPLVRAHHGPVGLPPELGAHPLELRAAAGAPIDVALVEGVERLAICRIVERLRLLEAVEHFQHLGR
jgi:hypothetical protein